MGFTTVVRSDGHVIPVAVCDSCRELVGPSGRVIWGPRSFDVMAWMREEVGSILEERPLMLHPPSSTRFTSVNEFVPGGGLPPYTVGVACSEQCHIRLFLLWKDPDVEIEVDATGATVLRSILVEEYLFELLHGLRDPKGLERVLDDGVPLVKPSTSAAPADENEGED